MYSHRGINDYVDAFISSNLYKVHKLPLVVFSADDMCACIKMLQSHHNIDPSIVKIQKDTNAVLSCRHFPYTCVEVPWEHYNAILSGHDDCFAHAEKEKISAILARHLNVHIVNIMKACLNMWTIVGMIVAALRAHANDTFCNCNNAARASAMSHDSPRDFSNKPVNYLLCTFFSSKNIFYNWYNNVWI